MTEREKFRIGEMKETLMGKQGGKCAACGSPLQGRCDLAHRIPQQKAKIKVLGKEVIHHEWNLAAVCAGNLKCNKAMEIGKGQWQERAALLEKIQKDLGWWEA